MITYDRLYEIIAANDGETRGDLADAIMAEIREPESVDKTLSTEYAGHMTTTTSTAAVTTIVNPNPQSVALGVAVLSLIMAQTVDRPHLQSAIQTVQFDKDNGVSLLMKDGGTRQHLANALRLGGPKDVERFPVPGIGNAFSRSGEIHGVFVRIWSVNE